MQPKKMFGNGLKAYRSKHFSATNALVTELGVKGLRYLSAFTLTDSRSVIASTELKPVYPVISLLLFTALVVLSLVRYQKKELV